MEIKIYGTSHVGLVRKMNQDSFFYDETMGFGMVADGIGGLPGGEIASQMAVQSVAKAIWSSSIKYSEVASFMLKQVYKANLKIFDYGLKNSEYKGLGTTLDFAYFVGETVNMVHVGDSRIYVYYRDHIFQLTIDHNLETFAQRGIVSLRSRALQGNQSKITRGLGLQEHVELDVFQKVIYSGEIYLLASDGLFDMVEDHHIKRVITENLTNVAAIPEKLLHKALKNGGKDNISIVICAVG